LRGTGPSTRTGMVFNRLYRITPSPEARTPMSSPFVARRARAFSRILRATRGLAPAAMMPVLLGMGSVALAADSRTVSLAVGEGQLIRLSQPAATVFVANPEIADVQVPDGTAIFVLGKRSGTT